VTAAASVISILKDFSISNKMDLYTDDFAMAAIKFSYAYFVYDLYDMLRMNNWNPL